MGQLAIKGHATRGKEVIELLEMMGGVNTAHFQGEKIELAYYIEVDKSICCIDIETEYHTEFYKITIEEFEEKFPYKVGDKVLTDDGDKAIIVGMVWDDDIDDVFYETQICNEIIKYPQELLQPYKEETIEESIDKTNKVIFDANAQCCDIMNDIIKEETMEELLIGFIKDENGNMVLNTHKDYEIKEVDGKFMLLKKKPQYPKTYEECCNVLKHVTIDEIRGYKDLLLENLQMLLVCRDAYWKIAGDWKPEYEVGVVNTYYTIHTFNNKLFRAGTSHRNAFLSFPTEEMRDAFYENFNDLIEQCKELL